MENRKEMRKWLDDMNLGHPLVVAESKGGDRSKNRNGGCQQGTRRSCLGTRC